MNAGMELMYYLVADGYRIKTPLFNLRMKIPGEYLGSETHLPRDLFPVARLQITERFRAYLREKVKVRIDGIDSAEGYIAEIHDESMDVTDDTTSQGHLLTIRGWGLKINGNEENTNKHRVGVSFMPAEGTTGLTEERASIIAVNEPRTLKIIVPESLQSGGKYTLKIVTQSSARNGAHLLKDLREIVSDTVLSIP